MIRFSRMLATRLQRLATHTRRRATPRAPAAEAWMRFEQALTAPTMGVADTRRRELAREGTRLAITLLGQQGRAAYVRILAANDGDGRTANEAVRVALAVAATLGHAA